jgi:pyrroline-5-carboxylate reductase
MGEKSTKKIAILGCGNLGKAILEGLLASGDYLASNITVTKRNIDSLDKYLQQGVNVTTDNKMAVSESQIIVVALKPHNILTVLENIKEKITPAHILISLATGVSIAQIEAVVATGVTVFRAMPNTATEVKESITCICGNSENPQQIKEVSSLFNELGESVFINEDLMESATVLGACGIAFVLRFIRGMIQGGIEIGFDARTAGLIVHQTVKGASELLIQNKNHPEFEIDKVTTPRGCTITGLNEMEHNGFSSALIKGIVASYEKIEK